MAVTVGAFAAFYYYRDGSANAHTSAKGGVAVKNPFSLTAAAKFGALFAVILLAVKIVQETMPPSGLYAVAALSGLVDVDAITLSMAELAQNGQIPVQSSPLPSRRFPTPWSNAGWSWSWQGSHSASRS